MERKIWFPSTQDPNPRKSRREFTVLGMLQRLHSRGEWFCWSTYSCWKPRFSCLLPFFQAILLWSVAWDNLINMNQLPPKCHGEEVRRYHWLPGRGSVTILLAAPFPRCSVCQPGFEDVSNLEVSKASWCVACRVAGRCLGDAGRWRRFGKP